MRAAYDQLVGEPWRPFVRAVENPDAPITGSLPVAVVETGYSRIILLPLTIKLQQTISIEPSQFNAILPSERALRMARDPTTAELHLCQ